MTGVATGVMSSPADCFPLCRAGPLFMLETLLERDVEVEKRPSSHNETGEPDPLEEVVSLPKVAALPFRPCCEADG